MAPLAKERLDEFLALPLIARLGTVSPGGDPYVVPIWYEWDGEAVVMSARERSRYLANLRRHPRACVSIAEDREPLRRVLIRGRAEIIREAEPDRGAWLERSRALCRRYLGDQQGDDYQDETLDRNSVWFRVVPDEVVSWDSPEWHPRYYR